MSVKENLKIAKELYDAFNSKDFSNSQNLIDDNAQFQLVPFNTKLFGKEGYLQVVQGWANTFPDGFCDIINITASEDGAAVEFIGRGTQNGSLFSPAGEIKPTGKRVNVPFCEVMKIKNGKVISLNTYFDVATMMHQLELVPEKV